VMAASTDMTPWRATRRRRFRATLGVEMADQEAAAK
jgi:hypothetical protein